MGILDRFKQAVENAKDEIDEKLTLEIDHQQSDKGYMRQSKSEPLKRKDEK